MHCIFLNKCTSHLLKPGCLSTQIIFKIEILDKSTFSSKTSYWPFSELINFPEQEQAQISIFECIESWYNRRRRHSALGYQTLEEFEKNNYIFITAA